MTITTTPIADLNASMRSFAHLLDYYASACPEVPAVSWVDEDAVVTIGWRVYRDRVRQLAAAYVELGVGPGDRVALLGSNRLEFLLADLAALLCGAVSVPMYATLANDQLAHVIADAQPRLVVVEGEAAGARIAALPSGDMATVVVPRESEPEVHSKAPFVSWQALESLGAVNVERHSTLLCERCAAIHSTDPATYIYTSGTTGLPKGVILTHGNLLFQVDALARGGVTDYAYSTVSYLPLAHVAERLCTLYLPLRLGGHVMCCPDVSRLTECLRLHRPSWFMAVPRVWEKLKAGLETVMAKEVSAERRAATESARQILQREWDLLLDCVAVPATLRTQAHRAREGVVRELRVGMGLDLDRLCVAWSSAAPLREEVARFFASLDIHIHQGYGMTETGGPSVCDRVGGTVRGAVGCALPGVDIKVADDGELLLRSPGNTPGYVNLPELTRDLFTEDGFIRTGDIGHVDEAGMVYITDRKKDLIVNAAGKNIAPMAVESLIAGRSFVSQVLAIGDERPYLVALLTVDPGKLLNFAKRRGIPEARVEALIAHPEVLAEVQRCVDEANYRLSRPEQVKHFRLLDREWSVEAGELTPTFKLRRGVIGQRFASEVNALYEANTRS